MLFGGLLLWTFLSLCYPLYDTDFWWHLKTGEWILQEGRIPQVDLYTFTEVGKPWIDLHWGFQLLITFLYRLGGVDLVSLVKAAVITGAVAVAWQAGGRRLPVWGKAALWILPVICISGRGYERPEMLSQLFLACWMWMATHVDRRPGLIWFLPMLQVVWVNCHALFVLGLVVGACYAADCVARDVARGRWGLAPPAPKPSSREIIWAAGLVALACLANPYFEEGALFPLTLYRKFSVEQDFYSKNVGEFHRPIDFLMMFGWKGVANIYLLSEVGVWCVTAASFVWLIVHRRRWSVLRLLLFAGFSQLAWKATRNTNIFAIVSGFVACENLSEAMIPEGQPAAGGSRLPRTWGMAALLAGLILAVVSGLWNEIGEQNKPFALGEAREWFMHDAAKFAGQPGFPGRAFVSHNGQAAVYIYHNAPERLVFMDGRLEVCSRNTFEVYNWILSLMADANPGWQEVFKENKGELPAVLLDNRMSLLQIRGLLMTPGWRLVFSDPVGAVFLSNEQADKLALVKVEPSQALADDLREVERRLSLVRSALSAPKGRPGGRGK
ncbi:MAG: hypothetical protein ACM3U2_13350 [Deltaproteobacteria bacterium]